MKNVLGDNIKSRRKLLGLTQKQLGIKCEICQESISLYETGARMPPIIRLCKLADVMGISLYKLLGR